MTTLWTACAILLNKMSAADIISMAGNIKEQLPADIIDFIKQAGKAAEKRQQRLYIVGGVVADLLLGRCNTDLDLVVEGDAIKLAEEIAALNNAQGTVHPLFGRAHI